MKKEIVYLVGLPCSGKSTYVQENYKDYVVISNDAIIEEYAQKNNLNYSQSWETLSFNDVTRECQKRFDDSVKKGQSILIDNTNMTVKARAIYNATGYEKNAVVFLIDETERLRRTEKRAKETGKRIPQKAIAHMKSIFKTPTFQEGFKDITVVSCDGLRTTVYKQSPAISKMRQKHR